MKLAEIIEKFEAGSPIRRKEIWGKDVFMQIRANGHHLSLYRRTPDGKTSTIQGLSSLDPCFSLDDIRATDWEIAE